MMLDVRPPHLALLDEIAPAHEPGDDERSTGAHCQSEGQEKNCTAGGDEPDEGSDGDREDDRAGDGARDAQEAMFALAGVRQAVRWEVTSPTMLSALTAHGR